MRRRSSSSHRRLHVFLIEPAESPAGVEKVIRVSGSKKEEKKKTSHLAVRKVHAICWKLLPSNDVSEEDAEPGSRITAGGPVQLRLCGILLHFF